MRVAASSALSASLRLAALMRARASSPVALRAGSATPRRRVPPLVAVRVNVVQE
ncbi:hypothetical protein K530_48300 [Streptomyces noursei CCRC 11814]|nr:hypothetical protein K530_48300 [Streptomyces noursei CCRC 11814]